MKRILGLVMAFLLCIPLCGCDTLDTNIENAATPPKLTEEQIEIFAAMESMDFNNNGTTLKYPQSGDNRSAIVIKNIDEEDSDEALIFYELKSDTETNLFMSVADQIDGQWQFKWRMSLNGTDVDKVSFLTDNDSGKTFIIVGTIDQNSSKAYQVFSYYLDDSSTQSQSDLRKMDLVYTGNYQMFEVYDIDDDSEDEIIVITQTGEVSNKDTTETSAIVTKAVLLQYDQDTFIETHQVPVNGSVLEYVGITKNVTTFGQPALFLDELVSESSYGTEILVFEDNTLKNLTYSEESPKLYDNTLRNQVPYCYDIMGDGKLEIPQTQYMKGYNEKSSSPMYITYWNTIQDGIFNKVSTTYINYAQGFGIKLYDEWIDKISAKIVVENEEVTFFKYKGSIDDDSEKIFSVKIDTSTNIQKNGIPSDYFVVKTTGQLVFLAQLHTGNFEGIDINKDMIKENFIDLYTMGD